jgi:hypothetical protein
MSEEFIFRLTFVTCHRRRNGSIFIERSLGPLSDNDK